MIAVGVVEIQCSVQIEREKRRKEKENSFEWNETKCWLLNNDQHRLDVDRSRRLLASQASIRRIREHGMATLLSRGVVEVSRNLDRQPTAVIEDTGLLG